MKLSFVIPAYNEAEYIGECLDSILHYAAGRYLEIIVVDNGSVDKTSEVAKLRPGVRVVREENRGITHARQRGLEEARGDLIAYIDADTRLTPFWLDIAEQTFKEKDDVVSLSGPYRYYDGFFIKRWLVTVMSLSVLPIGYFFFGYMLIGGNYIAKKQALIAAGGFDRSVDFFGEDTEIGRRLHLQGSSYFRYAFFVYSSARRFYEEGLFRTNSVYLLNYLWVVLFYRPFSKTHRDIRTKYSSLHSSFYVISASRLLADSCSHFFKIISRTLARKRPFTPRRTKIVTTAESSE
jgi:glycosyltransferase involved in cell wall biosynthesis